MPPTDRRSIVDAIKTPLGFFSLVVLVIESVLGGLAASLRDPRLAYTAAAILVVIVLIVSVLTWHKPEPLFGKRATAIDDSFAAGLGEELYRALDGYYSNLNEDKRAEAYILLRDTISSSRHIISADQKKFCDELVATIVRNAQLTDRWKKL